ncbi:cortex morphogenetic protein CmpA [Salicibibacter cibi]|uniref:Cortex morphogenetic protein CmpA n=1 Tax=Salicibibacter cibi TaxID=2743001 RepID=A0A7T6Z923_9BACI|nr:cortex morphogenetic protein CmpA [Salicibibacter cibi]QQK79183.1 cortex morphogenetic protein CmpA [Salicibibacter cibi]
MPYWLKKQLAKAYFEKNRYEIVMLNQCWFAYLKRNAPTSAITMENTK